MAGQRRHFLSWSLRVSNTIAVCLFVAIGTGPLTVVAQDATPMAVAPTAVQAGALTQARPYLVASDPDQLSITPLLTSGETVDDYQMAGTPDGLGAYQRRRSRRRLHEPRMATDEGKHLTDARVSLFTLDRTSAAVPPGSYPIDGSEGYWSFCSAFLAGPDVGFDSAGVPHRGGERRGRSTAASRWPSTGRRPRHRTALARTHQAREPDCRPRALPARRSWSRPTTMPRPRNSISSSRTAPRTSQRQRPALRLHGGRCRRHGRHREGRRAYRHVRAGRSSRQRGRRDAPGVRSMTPAPSSLSASRTSPTTGRHDHDLFCRHGRQRRRRTWRPRRASRSTPTAGSTAWRSIRTTRRR